MVCNIPYVFVFRRISQRIILVETDCKMLQIENTVLQWGWGITRYYGTDEVKARKITAGILNRKVISKVPYVIFKENFLF